MKRAFEQFAAWQLAPPSKPRRYIPRAMLDEEAQQRWDGEGGNIGAPQLRRKRERARQLARIRKTSASFETRNSAWQAAAFTP